MGGGENLLRVPTLLSGIVAFSNGLEKLCCEAIVSGNRLAATCISLRVGYKNHASEHHLRPFSPNTIFLNKLKAHYWRSHIQTSLKIYTKVFVLDNQRIRLITSSSDKLTLKVTSALFRSLSSPDDHTIRTGFKPFTMTYFPDRFKRFSCPWAVPNTSYIHFLLIRAVSLHLSVEK